MASSGSVKKLLLGCILILLSVSPSVVRSMEGSRVVTSISIGTFAWFNYQCLHTYEETDGDKLTVHGTAHRVGLPLFGLPSTTFGLPWISLAAGAVGIWLLITNKQKPDASSAR